MHILSIFYICICINMPFYNYYSKVLISDHTFFSFFSLFFFFFPFSSLFSFFTGLSVVISTKQEGGYTNTVTSCTPIPPTAQTMSVWIHKSFNNFTFQLTWNTTLGNYFILFFSCFFTLSNLLKYFFENFF